MYRVELKQGYDTVRFDFDTISKAMIFMDACARNMPDETEIRFFKIKEDKEKEE